MKKARARSKRPRCGDYNHFVIRNGKKVPCQRFPIKGADCCPRHGGSIPAVKAAAKRRIFETTAALIDPDRLLRMAAVIAHANVKDFFDDKGNLLPLAKWPDEMSGVISSVEVVKRNIYADDGKVDDVIKLKLWDKLKALEMLFKHAGLLKEQVEHTGGLEVTWKE